MSINDLFADGVIEVAAQPKDNALDLAQLQQTKLLFFPIDHDYPGGSVAMHNAVFRHYGLDYRSCFIVADPARVAEIASVLKADERYIGGGAGSGFKDKIGPHLDGLAPSAQVIGSVNVIAREEGKLIGYNTDGIGFVNGLLAEYPNCIDQARVVILGAGGTALPIAYEMAQKNPQEIIVCNRTVAKAQKIASLVEGFCPASGVGEDQIAEAFAGADIVINTSNKGAQPNEQYSAFAPMSGDPEADMQVARSNLAALPKSAIVADILLEESTLTLSMAQQNGNPTHSGRHMNLYQAVPAFKIMTGLDKPDSELLDIMQGALA